MASLFNTRISDTYSGLIKTIDNSALTASLKELTDGSGLSSGVYMNNAGDFKVTSILEFGSLKDTGENIIISKFVDAADGIGNNDNDTTIPTTAAIIDYVAAQITIEDLDFTGDTGSGQIDLDSQIFAIGGTTNEITTVASGQSLTLSLDSTGVNLPDNSTAITQTAGDNSTKIATTSYVDTLDAASDLDFSGDSGTGDVNLNTQTFAVTGTANQIESTASNQGLSLQFPSAGITLPNGSVATTQSAGDNSTKVATTSYVDTLDAASDLDITDGTNTGDVNLNTQSLSILGTTNEIDSVVSGQSVTLGLPNQINVNVQGNLTGNVTGDVTGDLTGNSAGTHTGAVIGNVTGNVTGDVTGDLTGNADTATAWETARDLSLTGQATGTISSVDGTNNVSGTVTLDNNSVTGKVLTGLTSPSASSVLATDTIVEGFGKLQSQVNGLAGGLRFMGSWDADTNSPVLSSGGGEAANGTTTSTTANKLVDSSASFTSTVTVGDQVVNQVDGQTALVSNVDSDTTLSLDADIMLTGEAYTIDNSPFITQGHYYVVSVGGTTTLNGVSNWTIGDWVIAGANNQWTKLDHSQVDGTGTTGNLTKWSSTSVIADSIVSESGTAITVDGSLTTNTNLSSTGNFAVNTDKFTVGASTGNTAFTGDLAINTNKFTVNATSGNTAIAGDVSLPNNSKAIFGANDNLQTYSDGTDSYVDNTGGELKIRTNELRLLNYGTGKYITADSGADVSLYYNNVKKLETTSTGVTFSNLSNTSAASSSVDEVKIGSFGAGRPAIYFGTSNTTYTNSTWFMENIGASGKFRIGRNGLDIIEISNAGDTTFAGDVKIAEATNKGQLFFGTANTDYEIKGGGNYGYLSLNAPILRFDTGGTERMRIDSLGNSTFAGNVKSNSTTAFSVGTVGNIGNTAGDINIYSSSSGHNGLRMHANGILPTDNAGTIIDNDADLGFPTYRFKDLYLGGSITSGGGATFAGEVNASRFILPSTGTTTPANQYLFTDNTNTGTGSLIIQSGVGSNAYGGAIRLFSHSNASKPGWVTVGISSGSNGKFTVNTAGLATGTDVFTVEASGNVGIGTGTDSPDNILHIRKGDTTYASQVGADTMLFLETTNVSNALQFTSANTGQQYIMFGDDDPNAGWISYNHSDNNLNFRVNGLERMRIDSNGNVGIGGVSASSQLSIGGNAISTLKPTVVIADETNGASLTLRGKSPILYFDGTAAGVPKILMDGQGIEFKTGTLDAQGDVDLKIDSSGILKVGGNDSGYPSTLIHTGNYTASQSGINILSSSTGYGYILFGDGDGAAAYTGQITYKHGDEYMAFNTNGSERMRITSGGDVLFGTQGTPNGTSVYGSAFLPESVNRTVLRQASSWTGTSTLQTYYNPNGPVGSIKTNGFATTFNTSSDYRLKEDLQDFAGLDMVSKIPVYDFKWKTDDSRSYGVMAHELQEVLPDAVSGEKDAEDMQSVDYSKIVPLLVKSIQELKAEVDKLKQECKCKN